MTFVKLMNKWENNGDLKKKKIKQRYLIFFSYMWRLVQLPAVTKKGKKNARCEISRSQNSFRQDSQTMS